MCMSLLTKCIRMSQDHHGGRHRGERVIAISQSNYIPWKGYFDLIAKADEFVIYDDVQFTRRDWRNRNLIKTAAGPNWVTIPIKSKGNYYQTIRDTQIDGTEWADRHWKSIEQNYRKSKHFAEIRDLLQPMWLAENHRFLSDLNRSLITQICQYLGIDTKISTSTEYHLDGNRSERLLNIVKQANGQVYLSGPAAQTYLDAPLFIEENVQVSWMDYSGYPSYPQLWGEFVHRVSIIDLLFNCGPESIKYMKYAGAAHQ